MTFGMRWFSGTEVIHEEAGCLYHTQEQKPFPKGILCSTGMLQHRIAVSHSNTVGPSREEMVVPGHSETFVERRKIYK